MVAGVGWQGWGAAAQGWGGGALCPASPLALRPRTAQRPSAHPATTKQPSLLPPLPPCTALGAGWLGGLAKIGSTGPGLGRGWPVPRLAARTPAPAPLAGRRPTQPSPSLHHCCHSCHPALPSGHDGWGRVAGMGGSCPGLGRGGGAPHPAALAPPPPLAPLAHHSPTHQACPTAATTSTLPSLHSTMVGVGWHGSPAPAPGWGGVAPPASPPAAAPSSRSPAPAAASPHQACTTCCHHLHPALPSHHDGWSGVALQPCACPGQGWGRAAARWRRPAPPAPGAPPPPSRSCAQPCLALCRCPQPRPALWQHGGTCWVGLGWGGGRGHACVGWWGLGPGAPLAPPWQRQVPCGCLGVEGSDGSV